MGRFLMYFVILTLGVFVICAYTLFDHGGGSIASNKDFSVLGLTAAAHVQDGQRVDVAGELEYNAETDEYSITGDGKSVLIRNYQGPSDLSTLIGTQVRVTGTFEEDDSSIEAESIVSLVTPTAAAGQ